MLVLVWLACCKYGGLVGMHMVCKICCKLCCNTAMVKRCRRGIIHNQLQDCLGNRRISVFLKR